MITLDAHVSTKLNTLRTYLGGLGGYPPRSRRNFKKIKQNGGFSFIIFAIWHISLDPQNYELAPQLPLNNYQCSPDP